VNWKALSGGHRKPAPQLTSTRPESGLTDKARLLFVAVRRLQFVRHGRLSVECLCLLSAVLLVPSKPASAFQTSAIRIQRAETKADVSTPASDPFGRDTPRGSVLGFLAAVRRDDYDSARQFLATPKKEAVASELADQLAYVVNHATLGRVSDQPEGSSQPVLPQGTERIGVVATADGPFNLDLNRVNNEEGHWIWVFSANTVRDVPSAYESLSAASINRTFPISLRDLCGSSSRSGSIYPWPGAFCSPLSVCISFVQLSGVSFPVPL